MHFPLEIEPSSSNKHRTIEMRMHFRGAAPTAPTNKLQKFNNELNKP
jgi:hypothetical protein